MRYIYLFFLFISVSGLHAQQIHVFDKAFFPSKPFGGDKELQRWVKQEIVYPAEALSKNIEGEVFINYKVDVTGNVIYSEVVDHGHTLLGTEAKRIFDKIRWETDDNRSIGSIELEKLRIVFNKKKYLRLVKKRGYDQLPYGDYKIDESSRFYTINQVDKKPQIEGNTSINDFVSQQFKYPTIAHQRGISGRVTAEFIIEPYGKSTNIRILEPVPGGCNEETMRLIQAMTWIPAFKDKQAVRTVFQYQLNFVHPGGTVK